MPSAIYRYCAPRQDSAPSPHRGRAICSGTRKRRHGAKTTADASTGDQTYRIAGLAMKRKQSVDFTGYWQRHIHENGAGAN